MLEKKIKGVKYVRLSCANCGAVAWKKKANITLFPNTFCSLLCKNAWKLTGKNFLCANPGCNQIVYRRVSQQKKSKSGDHFCSKSCAVSVNNRRHKSGSKHPNWNGGSEYRKQAIKYYGAKCCNKNCDLTEAGIEIPEAMLDVHHLRGRGNNELINLRVLCVWCHAKKTRGLLARGMV